MAFLRKEIMLVMLVVIMTNLRSTMAAVYEVGDSTGWTFNYNYEQWADSKNFQLGDALIFNYDPQLHNVKQVDKKDYDSCTDHNAVASFYAGNDSLTLETPGEFYFLCGIPGHCASGLRFHIKIARPVMTPPAMTYTPPETTLSPPFPDVPGYPAKTPTSSTAYSSKCTWLSMISMLFPLVLSTSMLLSMV